MERKEKTIPTKKLKTCSTRAKWSIITALDYVLEEASGSKLSERFWKSCAAPLEFLEKELKLTKVQIVFLVIMIEAGESVSWRGFAKFLDCSRLSVMTYSEDFEELLPKGWIYRTMRWENGRNYQSFSLEYGVVNALRHNKVFVPEKICDLDIGEFVARLESHLNAYFERNDVYYSDEEEWMLHLCKSNPNLPLCHQLLLFDDTNIRSLLLLFVYDYAQWAGSDDEGLSSYTIDKFYPSTKANMISRKLNDGSHLLVKMGYVEQKCEAGMADNAQFVLTKKCKEELLAGFVPSRSKCPPSSNKQFLRLHTDIKNKQMFYNAVEQEQIAKLTHLLSQDNLSSVQERLEESGMRKGFACLFYGAPGTGKTESVLQIARQTGRNIMQVDIAGMRDKFVGESEKNIKAVFHRYREICKHCDVMPILFFNEADAIINRRTENIKHSVDKMDNAMQNIILQEMEDLEGILIATTNLTSNLDNAFERRFLFKVEFRKPDNEIKAKLWNNMIRDITEEQAAYLARNYDFSGGQIENIARKRTIDYILSGSSPSLEMIEGYCKSELLKHKSVQRIGFSR